jgi:HAD superfamily hydrolase (TIGR01484 family)
MGKFDGILICSDWDGTLFCNGEVPKGSVDAIKYFRSEGGIFTVCSGRQPSFLREYSRFVAPNTYALCYNGALICDLESGEIIKDGRVGKEAFDAADMLIDCGADIKVINIACVGENEFRRFKPEEFRARKNELAELAAYKITLGATDEADGLMMVEAVKQAGLIEHSGVRSFKSYIEILHNDNLKGVSARFLKERLGAKILVGMGDFENDFDLLEKADVGYAVGNAIDALKAIADKVTVRCDECAVAKIIEDIENTLTK